MAGLRAVGKMLEPITRCDGNAKIYKILDVTFVNAARHTISVLTNWKNKKEVAARDLEAGQRVPFENVNLDEIESFTITFKKGWRPLYGYIPV